MKKADLLEALRKIGIKAGDRLLVHSSFKSLDYEELRPKSVSA